MFKIENGKVYHKKENEYLCIGDEVVISQYIDEDIIFSDDRFAEIDYNTKIYQIFKFDIETKKYIKIKEFSVTNEEILIN